MRRRLGQPGLVERGWGWRAGPVLALLALAGSPEVPAAGPAPSATPASSIASTPPAVRQADWQRLYDAASQHHAARDAEAAESAARHALALARQIPAAQQPPFAASSLNLLALVLRQRGQDGAAAELLAEALALNEASLGVHANTASVALNLGAALEALQRPREAVAPLRRCLDITGALPDGAMPRELRRQALLGLERLHTALAEPEAASGYRQRLLAADGQATAARPRERAEALLREARALAQRGQADAAANLQRQALALHEAAGPGAGLPDAALAEPLNELGLWHAARQEYPQAEALLQRAQQLVEAQAGQQGEARQADLARVLASRAQVLEALARDDEARALNQQSLALYRALGEGGPELWVGQAGVLNSLAGNVYRKRRFKEAEPLFLEALGLMERALGPDDTRLLPLLDNLQALYRSQGRPALATPHAQRAVELRKKAGDGTAGAGR